MAVLVDSNVLIFSVQGGHPFQEESIQAIEFFLRKNETAYILLQNIAEFWNVCTRPIANRGLGLSIAETARRLADLDAILTVLHEPRAAYREWRNLILNHDVKGVQVYDARLAAVMKVSDIERILTYNPEDFKRYAGVVAIHPKNVAAALRQ